MPVNKSFVIQNCKKITEGVNSDNPKVTYLNSIRRHDCLGHELSNGHTVMVDGGNSFADGGYYGRGTMFDTPEGTLVEDFCLDEKSTFEEICDKLLYTGGTSPYINYPKPVTFAELSEEELKKLLASPSTMLPLQRVVAFFWMKKRGEEIF